MLDAENSTNGTMMTATRTPGPARARIQAQTKMIGADARRIAHSWRNTAYPMGAATIIVAMTPAKTNGKSMA